MTASPFIIAEAGVNHDGDLDRALELVDAAAAADADAVKFQTFRADALASRHAATAPYQKAAGAGEDQRAMLRRLEMTDAMHQAVIARCAERGIEFLSTPFDPGSLAYLIGTKALKRLKLGSGEVTNGPLLLAAARTGLPLILSTGMATLDEIDAALGVLAFGYGGGTGVPGTTAFQAADRGVLKDRLILLHCTTAYPAPADSINLRAMDQLAEVFGLPVGLSDHSRGHHVSLAAAARGAVVIEKHFTLDRRLPGPDHAASLEPGELARMVAELREVAAALGDGRKAPAAAEAANAAVARKSLVAARPIRPGEVFTPDMLACKRPGTGLNPMRLWDLCGRPARRGYEPDEAIAAEEMAD